MTQIAQRTVRVEELEKPAKAPKAMRTVRRSSGAAGRGTQARGGRCIRIPTGRSTPICPPACIATRRWSPTSRSRAQSLRAREAAFLQRAFRLGRKRERVRDRTLARQRQEMLLQWDALLALEPVQADSLRLRQLYR